MYMFPLSWFNQRALVIVSEKQQHSVIQEIGLTVASNYESYLFHPKRLDWISLLWYRSLVQVYSLEWKEKSKSLKTNFKETEANFSDIWVFVCHFSECKANSGPADLPVYKVFPFESALLDRSFKERLFLSSLRRRSGAEKLAKGKHEGLLVVTSCLLWAPVLRYPAQPLSLIHPLLSAGALCWSSLLLTLDLALLKKCFQSWDCLLVWLHHLDTCCLFSALSLRQSATASWHL